MEREPLDVAELVIRDQAGRIRVRIGLDPASGDPFVGLYDRAGQPLGGAATVDGRLAILVADPRGVRAELGQAYDPNLGAVARGRLAALGPAGDRPKVQSPPPRSQTRNFVTEILRVAESGGFPALVSDDGKNPVAAGREAWETWASAQVYRRLPFLIEETKLRLAEAAESQRRGVLVVGLGGPVGG